jgi:hypothetical protein
MTMKNILFLLGIIVVLASSACKKSSSDTDPSAGANFKFTSILATDTVIKVNAVTSLTAVASGDGLTYKWASDYGTIIGSGANIQWTVCHQDKFSISCQVTDKYNHAETKNIVVRSIN